MNLGTLRAALENINISAAARPTYAKKKSKKPATRKSVKKRNAITKKNREKQRAKEIRAARAQRLAARREKVEFQTTSMGIHGLDELSDAIDDFEHIYRRSRPERRGNLDSYLKLLTNAMYESFHSELKVEYEDAYPTLFNKTMADNDPILYLSELNNFIEDRLEEYDEATNVGDEAKQMEMDTIGEIIIDAANRVAIAREEVRENDAMRNLLSAFGSLRV